MTKTSHILLSAMAGLLLAACSDEPAGGRSETTDEVAYLGISINTPVPEPGSRDGNDGGHELADGLANEYAIDHGYLLLFAGEANDPDNAEFCGAFTLGNPIANGNNNPQVSKIWKVDVTLDHFAKEPDVHYYGLILANTQGIRADRYSLTYDNDGNTGTIYANNNHKYSDFKSLKLPMRRITRSHETVQTTNYLVDNANYALMTNAMLFNVTGSTAAAAVVDANNAPVGQELVDVTDGISLVPIEDDGHRVNFYVERVAAKVQVLLGAPFTAQGQTSHVKIYNGGNSQNASYRIVDWCVANVSPRTYLMRQWYWDWPKWKSMKPNVPYRMISPEGISGITDEGAYKYRCYYGDTEWSGTNNWSYQTASDAANPGFYAMPWTPLGENYASYCHENSMHVEQMMVKNATHVLVRVQFGDGTNWGANLWTPTDDKTKIISNADYQALPAADKAGYKQLTGGYAYYILPIMHFGDTFTPWKNGESTKVLPLVRPFPDDDLVNIDNSYPLARDNYNRWTNYLGRWGVVRNNWYVITLTDIKGVGNNVNPLDDPSIITTDPTPLDYYDTQMTATLKVRNWIVRDQTQTLE